MAHVVEDAIDLTGLDSDEDAESPRAAAAREAAQKQKIMDFARAKRARTGPAAGEQPINSTAAQAAAAAAAAAGPSTAGQLSSGAVQDDRAAGAASAAAASGAGFGNEDLKALHEARMQRIRAQKAAAGSSESNSSDEEAGGKPKGAAAAGPSSRDAVPSWFADQLGGGSSSNQPVSLLTYNVWFREDVALRQRMQGIADIIIASGHPTFVCFQEVTPRIMAMFATMPWWQKYICSPAPDDAPYFTLLLVNKTAAPSASRSSFEEVYFDNSCMGRTLRAANVTVAGRKVLVATSHLESPIPPERWYSRERQQQMAFSLAQLQKAPYGNVMFAGDMNWTDSRDGAPPLPSGWCDVWQQLHPGEPGYTYDARNNPMLPYKNTPPLRLDRIFARLSDFKLGSVSIVGKDQLGAGTYTHTFRNGDTNELPVLPSDHFGLLVKLDQL